MGEPAAKSPHVLLHLGVLQVGLRQRPEVHHVSQLLEFGLAVQDALWARRILAALEASTDVSQRIQPAVARSVN